MKVLLAEDSPSMMVLTSGIITDAGHEVIPAVDGEQAIERYTAEKPDLVILDVEMPVHDGFEVARQIRTLGEDRWVPIIFLTSFDSDDYLLQGINAGGDDYLTKPVSHIVLGAKLNAMGRISEMQNRLWDITRELSDINDRLRESSITDPLTKCFNRLYLDDCLKDEWMAASHRQSVLSLLIIDIDNFKILNDTNGHYAGDTCLIRMVQIFNTHICLTTDKLCRYGGDEFVIVMPGTDEETAVASGEAIRRSVMEFSNKYDLDVPVDLSVSIGCASCTPDKTISVDEFLKIADQALYEAKNAGRNSVVRASLSAGKYCFLNNNDAKAANLRLMS